MNTAGKLPCNDSRELLGETRLRLSRRDFCKAAAIGAIAASSLSLLGCSSGGAQREGANGSSQDAPSDDIFEGGPAELFNRPGRQVWFYSTSITKDTRPTLFVFENGTVSCIEPWTVYYSPTSGIHSPTLGDLEGLTDDEIIQKFEDFYLEQHDACESNPESSVSYQSTRSSRQQKDLGELTVIQKDPLEFPAIPLKLYATTDGSGNMTIRESFPYQIDRVNMNGHLEVEASDLNSATDAAKQVDVIVTPVDKSMVLGSPFPKPYQVYSTFFGGFTATDEFDEFFYTRFTSKEYDIHLDQPGTEGVTFS